MNAQANTPAAPAKNVEIFFTFKDSKGVPVSLWITHKTKEGSPDIDGRIGEQRVAGYLQQGANGGFISFIDSTKGKGEDGRYTQVGTGNVIAYEGRRKLVVTMADGAKVWAETSKKVEDVFLAGMGLNIELLAKQRAEKAAGAKAPEHEEAAAA